VQRSNSPGAVGRIRQESLQRLALTLPHLRQTIEGTKCPRFAVLQNLIRTRGIQSVRSPDCVASDVDALRCLPFVTRVQASGIRTCPKSWECG
jgi:hypothetical protein